MGMVCGIRTLSRWLTGCPRLTPISLLTLLTLPLVGPSSTKPSSLPKRNQNILSYWFPMSWRSYHLCHAIEWLISLPTKRNKDHYTISICFLPILHSLKTKRWHTKNHSIDQRSKQKNHNPVNAQCELSIRNPINTQPVITMYALDL